MFRTTRVFLVQLKAVMSRRMPCFYKNLKPFLIEVFFHSSRIVGLRGNSHCFCVRFYSVSAMKRP